MRPAYPREIMEQRVCEALEAGATLDQIATRPDWPSRQTVFRWARDAPGFARRLRAARAWRRGVRTQSRPGFDPVLAEAFLLAVRRGWAVRDLVRRPDGPNRPRLNRWKRERPDFAAELAAAVRFSAEERRVGWPPYDEAAGDQIIVRVSRGEPLPKVLADRRLPSKRVLRRWRRDRPDFDQAIRTAHLAGIRNRLGDRRRARMALVTERLTGLMIQGVSMLQASKAPGMPHYVTLQAWRRRDPEFARAVAWARHEGILALADLAVELSDRAGPGMEWTVARRIGAIRKQAGRMASKNRRRTDEEDDG